MYRTFIALGVLSAVLTACGGQVVGGARSSARFTETELNKELSEGWELKETVASASTEHELWTLRQDPLCVLWVTRLRDVVIVQDQGRRYCEYLERPIAVVVRGDCVFWGDIGSRDTNPLAQASARAGGSSGGEDAEEDFCYRELRDGPQVAIFASGSVRGACLVIPPSYVDGENFDVVHVELQPDEWTIADVRAFNDVIAFDASGDQVEDRSAFGSDAVAPDVVDACRQARA